METDDLLSPKREKPQKKKSIVDLIPLEERFLCSCPFRGLCGTPSLGSLKVGRDVKTI